MPELAQKSHKELLPIISEVRERIKKSDVIKDLCEQNDVGVDYIDLIPMAFADLDVSARTDKGCIYFNLKLLDDDDFLNDDHYMAHEVVHHFQQCHSDGPTTGGQGEDYLDNEYEVEGFQAQTEYLSETRDNDAAEEYVEQVLEHHDVPSKERKERKDELLNIAIQSGSLFKDAGLFKVPQPLIDKVSDYVRKSYSSNVLLTAQEELEKGKENNKLWDSLESEDEEGNVTGALEDFEHLFFGALDELEPGQDTTFNVGYHPATKLGQSHFAIKGYLGRADDQYTLYIDGGFDKDNQPVKITVESDRNEMRAHLSDAHRQLDKYVNDLRDYMKHLPLLEAGTQIEYEKLIQECRYQGGSDKAWSGMAVYALEEILDLIKGSPYIKDFDRTDMLKKLEKKWPPVVTVEMEYVDKIKSKQGDSAGVWAYGPMTLMLAVGDLEEYRLDNFHSASLFKNRLFAILITVNHELMHMLQFILRDLSDKNSWYGVTSKKLRDPSAKDPLGKLKEDVAKQYKTDKGPPNVDEYGQDRWEQGKAGVVPYALMDIEFYTSLKDSVTYFNEITKQEPPNIRLEHAKMWVGAQNKFVEAARNAGYEVSLTHTRPDSIFLWLKNQAPKKWQKAVKEFFKATGF